MFLETLSNRKSEACCKQHATTISLHLQRAAAIPMDQHTHSSEHCSYTLHHWSIGMACLELDPAPMIRVRSILGIEVDPGGIAIKATEVLIAAGLVAFAPTNL